MKRSLPSHQSSILFLFSQRFCALFEQVRDLHKCFVEDCRVSLVTMLEGLPMPGEIVKHDFREPGATVTSPASLKIVQWNIERGYKLHGIIGELQKLKADVIGLQEIDIQCERSGGVDVGIEIAKALKMNYAFVCEFVELRSIARVPRDQGGGVHGNAVLSRFDFASVEVVTHTHHPIDWESNLHPKSKAEPRKGQRLTICATLDIPMAPLVVYSVHLEVVYAFMGGWDCVLGVLWD